MYESPIKVYTQEVSRSMREKVDGTVTYEVETALGVHVDKDELEKALRYHRGQYNKGFEDGMYELDHFVSYMKEECHIDLTECLDAFKHRFY